MFDQRQWASSRYFKACNKENGLDHSRLGLAISKKISKSAVVRNMLKRHIRESFRCNQKVIKGLDIIVLSKQESVMANSIELRQDLNLLWKRCQK